MQLEPTRPLFQSRSSGPPGWAPNSESAASEHSGSEWASDQRRSMKRRRALFQLDRSGLRRSFSYEGYKRGPSEVRAPMPAKELSSLTWLLAPAIKETQRWLRSPQEVPLRWSSIRPTADRPCRFDFFAEVKVGSKEMAHNQEVRNFWSPQRASCFFFVKASAKS